MYGTGIVMRGRMLRAAVPAFLAALPLALAAGCEATGPDDAHLVTSELAGSDVVLEPGDLVYRYLLATVNADSLLRRMRADGVPVSEAFQPLEDLCEDPHGPRFTVVLYRIYEEVASFHFEPGSGIRACTVRVRRYTWSD